LASGLVPIRSGVANMTDPRLNAVECFYDFHPI
jgi:hypothetical protein